jgi:beta-lactamase regulating signal transducer with metallopeptidase domain
MSAMDMHLMAEQGLGLLGTLWRVTWQGALWALAVWVLTRTLPRLPPAMRATLWWFVGLKFLVGLLAPAPVLLPLLPAPASTVLVEERASTATGGDSRPVALEESEATPRVPSSEHAPTRTVWTVLVLGALLARLGGIAWQGRELLRGLAHVRRIRDEARPLEDATLQHALATLGRELGLTRLPRLLVSECAPSPLALGLTHPEVILPRKALETLSPLQQRMALAHELAHVRRGDLWLGWVPALARAVFFFHPLVRRACREYALAREEACDAAALQATGAAPREYGRLLLVFGVARAPAAAAAPGASSHLAALKRRIAMLEHVETESQPRTRQLRWLLGGLALAALVPFQVVARAPEAPTPPSAVLLAQAPAIPPTPPAPPPPPPPEPLGDEEDKAYVLVRPNDSSVAMSGSTRDLRRARSLAQGAKEPVLYLRRDEQEYLIRNPDTLKAFEAALKPLEQLGAKQGELGAQQGALGAKQGELGARMGELGAKQGELGQRHAELALARIQQERAGKESPEIERQQQELDRAQEELSRQMDALGEQMDVIGRQMDAVGDQMEAEGEKMEAQSREAEKKINTLLDDAVRKGVAEPVKR